ncbi:ATP-binding protein [Caulobacter sp. SL161]|uniref:ATP-binding protein n=1 Tax=Caulobacter sp. SL161 TaxID=2995156 RepID=UPI0022759F86|nr:ATP-binding protein [Caulobacter sp. SL161]MCY1648993.1 ATP-binding protein [Caulobacter sp. SL161]
MALRDILDDGQAGAMLVVTRRSRAARLIATAMVGGLLFFYLGWTALIVWLVANTICELWVVYLERAYRPDWGQGMIRFMRIGPPSAFAMVWSFMSAYCVLNGPMAMRYAALLILFGIVVEGVRYAMNSLAAMLSLTVWPFLMLAALPLLAKRFDLLDRFAAFVILLGLIGYVADAVRTMRASAKAREEAEAQALEASRAKSAFLAMMSHELRTPMNGVLGLAHALRGTKLDAQQSEYLEMIEQSGHGLMTILNDILDLSKIEAGKLNLEVAPFDLRKLALQTRAVWSESARLKGLDLILEVSPSVPPWVSGDATRVRQILMNLVSNALKFTESGRVVIRLGGEAGGVATLSVTDTGVGMTAEQIGRLFTPFAQGDASIARRFGGTGLGLSICRQLAELMAGEIIVSSEPGVGSTFTARLGLPAAAPLAAAPARAPATQLDGARVLVVDDNLVNQTVARAILEAVGAAVAVAGDGHAALARLRIEDFDVVLMDVHMPGMDGVEAVRRIRAGEAGRIDLPVVALTADAMAGDAERLLAQGFDDAHPKPVQPAGLLATVASLRKAPTELQRLRAVGM